MKNEVWREIRDTGPSQRQIKMGSIRSGIGFVRASEERSEPQGEWVRSCAPGGFVPRAEGTGPLGRAGAAIGQAVGHRVGRHGAGLGSGVKSRSAADTIAISRSPSAYDLGILGSSFRPQVIRGVPGSWHWGRLCMNHPGPLLSEREPESSLSLRGRVAEGRVRVPSDPPVGLVMFLRHHQ